jgi:hypothetical protein
MVVNGSISNAMYLANELSCQELPYNVKVKLDILGFEIFAHVTDVTWDHSNEQVNLVCSPKPSGMGVLKPLSNSRPPLTSTELFLERERELTSLEEQSSQLTLDFSSRNGYDLEEESFIHEEDTRG